MKSIEEVQEEIVDEFTSVDDWMDRYTMIIEEGNTLPPLPEQYRTPSNLIEGCQSRSLPRVAYTLRPILTP